MPSSNRAGFAAFLALTVLGWGYYVFIVFIIFVGLSAAAGFQKHALSLPELELYSAMFIGTLHGIPTGAAGILVLLAASRLSANRPALALVAATLAGACVILVSFFPPFLAHKELDLTGSAILRYATEVERMRWWHWLLLAGIQIPFLAACWRWLKLAQAVRPETT
jgi:hypothetical protein